MNPSDLLFIQGIGELEPHSKLTFTYLILDPLNIFYTSIFSNPTAFVFFQPSKNIPITFYPYLPTPVGAWTGTVAQYK